MGQLKLYSHLIWKSFINFLSIYFLFQMTDPFVFEFEHEVFTKYQANSVHPLVKLEFSL